MQDATDYPLDPALAVNPVLVLVLGAVVIALTVAAFLLGRGFEQRRSSFDHRRSAEDIHTAIARYAIAAVKAPQGELISRVESLLAEIEGRIGPARSLAAGSNSFVKALKDAVGGNAEKVQAKTLPAKESTVLVPAWVSQHGADGGASTDVLTPAFVAQKAAVTEDKKAPAAAEPLSMKEQLVRLRLAADEFSTWWCGSHGAREARIQELIAAQKALCHTGPLPPPPPLPTGHRDH
jgi:hypothetical protein